MSVERNNPHVADSRLCRRKYYFMDVKNRGLRSPRLFNFPSFRRFLLIVLRSSLTIRHAEFSSASVRGEGRKKARGEILKQVQDDGRLAHYSQLKAIHSPHRGRDAQRGRGGLPSQSTFIIIVLARIGIGSGRRIRIWCRFGIGRGFGFCVRTSAC